MKIHKDALWVSVVTVVVIGSVTVAELKLKSPSATPHILARWAQLVPIPDSTGLDSEGKYRISVRFVLDGLDQPCDGFLFSDESKSQAVDVHPRANPDTSNFKVTVCEGFFDSPAGPEGKAYFKNGTGGGSVLTWSKDPDSILVVGDTGCRKPEKKQDCPSPFGVVVKSAVKRKPALVLHVGDYRYRGNKGWKIDTWDNWSGDFFEPAADLLNSAPWLMVRGNHDNCYKQEEKGPGWLLLLSSSQWPDGCDDDRQIREKPYALDIKDDLRLVVTDTANAVNVPAWRDDFDKYKEQLRKLLKVDGSKSVWIVSHYPVINIEEDERKPHVLREKVLPMLTDSKVAVILSGDIHQFRILGMWNKKTESIRGPIQFVIANGGALLARGFGPEPKGGWPATAPQKENKEKWPKGTLGSMCPEGSEPSSFERVFATGTARGRGYCTHGYMIVTKERTGWNFVDVPLGRSTSEGCSVGGGSLTPCEKWMLGGGAIADIIVPRTGEPLYNHPLKGEDVVYDSSGKEEVGRIKRVLIDSKRNASAVLRLEEKAYPGKGGADIILPFETFYIDEDGKIRVPLAEVDAKGAIIDTLAASK